MAFQYSRRMLVLAFLVSIVAGAIPIGLSVKEIATLRSTVDRINASASFARMAKDVADKIGVAMTGFTAVALDIDPSERSIILAATDKHVTLFAQSVRVLKKTPNRWVTQAEYAELSEAATALVHSWEEIRDQAHTGVTRAEKEFHFLQLADSAKLARSVLSGIEFHAAQAVENQTNSAFERLTFAGSLLVASFAVVFLTSSVGSISIFRSSQSTKKANSELELAYSELKSTQETLKGRSEQLVEAQRLGKIGDWSYRLGESELYWASEVFDLLGYNPKTFHPTRDAVGAAFAGDGARLVMEAQAEVMRTDMVKSVDIKFRRGDGSVGDFALTSKLLTDDRGRAVGFSGTIQDISERKHAEDQLEKLAYYDPLTGLANRTMFHREMKDVLARGGRNGTCSALFLLDLDRFKDVNDTLGHAAGDELLIKVGHLLARVLGKGDFLARLGGDEFVIIVPQYNDQAEIENLAGDVVDMISGSINLERGEVHIGTSIGVVLIPRDGHNASDLLRNADLALYRAKEEGRGRFVLFEPTMSDDVQHTMALASDLRNAVSKSDELEVHYQPQVDISTGHVTGFESLMRWNHPTRGNVPPSEFIPIAESSSLICDIGLWILRQSVIQAKAWIDSGEPPREIAVNVSAAQIWHTDLVSEVEHVLKETGLPPHLLCLELTESLFADHSEARVRTALTALKELGVTLALDDFGTGYSSLGYLTQLPFDKLKVDRVFVDGIANSERSRQLLKGIVALGRGLGMTVVGEGAEKREEVEILRDFGCQLVQGYFFARPMLAAEALIFARSCEVKQFGIGATLLVSDDATHPLLAQPRAIAV